MPTTDSASPPGLGKFTQYNTLFYNISLTFVFSSWYAYSTNIRFFHSGSGDVTFSNVTIYEGLANAWPERKR